MTMSDPSMRRLDREGMIAATGDAFREAMSRVVGQVWLVAIEGPEGPVGFTATAVSSVSASPPTALVCASASGNGANAVVQAGRFSLNALSAEDQALAEIFSGRTGVSGAARFDRGAWLRGDGPPILSGARAALSCRLIEARPIATHLIIIGEVEAVRWRDAGPALAYRDRTYLPA